VQSGVDDDGEAGIMCWRCDHPGATTEEYLTYLAETLDRDRWVVQYVVSEHQPSAYTVGLHGLGLPELLVTGLPEKISVQLLDSAAHEMADHDTRLEPGMQIEFEGELVLEAVEVDHPDVHLRIAQQFYRRVFGALQLVWTDDERHWPWDRGWSKGRRWPQPVFGARDPVRLNSV